MALADLQSGSIPSGVTIFNPLECDGWDSALSDLPAASFFHGSSWARVLHSTYGYRPMYFARKTDGRLRSLLPLMEVSSWITGDRGISLPFTDECEPLCSSSSDFNELFQAALQFASQRSWKWVECRGGKQWFGAAAPSTSYWSHRLDLQSDEGTLFARCDDSTRRAVRKAEKAGVAVEFSCSIDSVRIFHNLLCQTRQRHGVPPQPFKFFARIHEHVLQRGHGCVALARLGEVPVASAVFFHTPRSAIFKFGASNHAFQHLRANNLVMWRAIQRFAHAGFAALDLGRTSLANEGLRRFKLAWGSSERSCDYYRYGLQAGGIVPVRDRSHGWHSRIFNVLPVFLSRLIGTAVYKHIA